MNYVLEYEHKSDNNETWTDPLDKYINLGDDANKYINQSIRCIYQTRALSHILTVHEKTFKQLVFEISNC